MTLPPKLKHELRALAAAGLFFGSWIAVLLVLKDLLLAEYDIAFHGWSMALVGALVLSKVVLLLEHVSLGAWVRACPAWVDVVLRTLMYTAGVFLVLVAEKAFEGRHEHRNLIATLTADFRQMDAHHVIVNTICMSGALLCYNLLAVIRQHLGQGGLLRLLMRPLPVPEPQQPASHGQTSASQ